MLHRARPFGIAAAILLLASYNQGDASPLAHTKESRRLVYVLAGPILFIAGESSSKGAAVRSWSAEENLGGSTYLVNGSLASGDVSASRKRIAVRTSYGYVLICTTTPTTKRDEQARSESRKIVSYDGTTPVLAETSSIAVSIDSLDCTLTTPDRRVFTGIGAYSRTRERTRSNAPPP